ncbi:MAG: hypothetical protein EU530_09180 [Promethearchaeota archaeon]|nr:MAG: hypothetical protein EU530_09180 [Candidatus Lokiarchaeota archaeon]
MRLEFGDVILAEIFFTDNPESKKRPAVVLFEEFDNIILAGITSNARMNGISLTKSEGAIKESVIKTNYIFTVARSIIIRKLFSLNEQKKEILCNEMKTKICGSFI